MNQAKIYIAGHQGMVGSSVLDVFRRNGYSNIVTRSRAELDLKIQQNVHDFMRQERPDIVILAAARVGGILANTRYPYPFLYDNLVIQNNVINAAHENDVRKLIFLGSSCIYPKHAPQPLKEEYLLTGPLEPTNQWYAVAKIAGVKLCQALNKQFDRQYISLMPTNLYGPRDNFDLETSHVVPAMIRKFHEAKEVGNMPVTLWGSGKPMREFLHVDDLADAVRFAVEKDLGEDIYNVGTGDDLLIEKLAQLIQQIIGHGGEIVWDKTKPDGTPRKLLDVSWIHAEGWHHKHGLKAGLEDTYRWFQEHIHEFKEVKLH